MNTKIKIYVGLLNEGIEVWRPVDAEIIRPNTYKILGIKPDDENWEFNPEEVVECIIRDISGESCLVAYKKIV